MSEQEQTQEQEATQEVEAEATTTEIEVQQDTQADTGDEGKGTQFIDFKELPPQVEARFRRVYRNMKEYERAIQESGKVNAALVERLEKLETDDAQQQINSLQVQRREAWESGDFDRATKLDDELLEHKLAAKERAQQTPTKVEVPQYDDGPLSEDQIGQLAAWSSEKNAEGQPLRPWAHPDHPQHKRAIGFIQSAVLDPDVDLTSPAGFQAVLKSVDSRMNGAQQTTTQQQPQAAAVLSGNGDARPPAGRKAVKLTPEQMRVAEGMGYSAEDYGKLIQKYGVN